jgi:hypothetical protein
MLRCSMTTDDAPVSSPVSQKLDGLGCAGTIATFNVIVMGFIAYIFSMMPYFNVGQELWYRGGSLTFLILGALVPICWRILIKRGYWGSAKPIAAWMFAALITFIGYVLLSGGGI